MPQYLERNALGLNPLADGRAMASKPYVASDKSMARMSNHRRSRILDPDDSSSSNACALTTFC